MGRAFLLETEYSTESGSMDETDSANQGHIRDNYSLLTLNRHRKLCSVGLKGWEGIEMTEALGAAHVVLARVYSEVRNLVFSA